MYPLTDFGRRGSLFFNAEWQRARSFAESFLVGAKFFQADGGCNEPLPDGRGTHFSGLCGLALDDVDGEAAAAGFFVFGLHVGTGLAHGFDDFVEGDVVLSVSEQGEA